MNNHHTSLQPSPVAQAIAVLLVLGSAAVGAQTAPNAGSIMNNIKDNTTTVVPDKVPSFDVQQDVRPALVAPGGTQVLIKSVKVSGNSVFPQAELDALLTRYVGKTLDLAGMDEAAGVISQYYRQRGYFVARAYLPAQEVTSGNLEIAVIEGRLGKVQINPQGDTRLRSDVAAAMVEGAAPVGSPINERSVERGLMLLNDLPGVDVKSTLVPGATPGTSNLVVDTTEGKLLSGSVDVDNFGAQTSGVYRPGATINFNDLSGHGDLLTVRAMMPGQGMTYARGAYTLPVGMVGTKVGLAYSDMRYTLGGDFSALNASGTADVTTAYVVQPFLRSRNTNFYGTLTYDSKSMYDTLLVQNAQNNNAKNIGVWSLGFNGDSRDALGGGGMNSGSLTVVGGNLGLGAAMNNNNAAADQAGPQTAGSYTKVVYQFSRLQAINDLWSLYFNFNGQSASKNLDSSEKFGLGGSGVRAYPQGEASGDSGNLMNLEARYNLPALSYGNLQLSGFIDYGTVTLHDTLWTGWQPTGQPNFPNTYSLAGAGFGANLYRENDFSVRASVAWKIGSNPGASAAGLDSDNNAIDPRFWIQANKQF